MLRVLSSGVRVVRLEAARAMRQSYKSPFQFFLQQLTWPLLGVTILVFSYAPFAGTLGFVDALTSGANGGASSGASAIASFVIPAMFVLSVFAEYVNVGSNLAYQRDFGTLEIVFLAPVRRGLIVFAAACGAAVSGAAGCALYLVLALSAFGAVVGSIPLAVSTVVLVIVLSLPWGCFVCSIFLIGRNSRFLYAVFETPSEFFSGARFPVSLFPGVLSLVAVAYPLSHSVLLVRQGFSRVFSADDFLKELLALAVLSVCYGTASALVLAMAERNAAIKGDLGYS